MTAYKARIVFEYYLRTYIYAHTYVQYIAHMHAAMRVSHITEIIFNNRTLHHYYLFFFCLIDCGNYTQTPKRTHTHSHTSAYICVAIQMFIVKKRFFLFFISNYDINFAWNSYVPFQSFQSFINTYIHLNCIYAVSNLLMHTVNDWRTEVE